MEYPGKELEIFDKARVFQKYIVFKIKDFIKDGIFEVGAGIGSFSRGYIHITTHIIYYSYTMSSFMSSFDKPTCGV